MCSKGDIRCIMRGCYLSWIPPPFGITPAALMYQVQVDCFSGDWSRGPAGEPLPRRLFRLYWFHTSRHPEVPYVSLLLLSYTIEGSRRRLMLRCQQTSITTDQVTALQHGGGLTSRCLSPNVSFHRSSVSQIREAIVNMLARPSIGQPSQEALDRHKSFHASTPKDSLNPSLRAHQLSKDANTCVFWSAVALGALVKGNPVESVSTLLSIESAFISFTSLSLG